MQPRGFGIDFSAFLENRTYIMQSGPSNRNLNPHIISRRAALEGSADGAI